MVIEKHKLHMKNLINLKMVNELLSELGHGNILLTDNPTFYWDGNTITDNINNRFSTFNLNKDFGLLDFLEENKGRKIVFVSTQEGGLVNDKNQIRAFVQQKSNKMVEELEKENVDVIPTKWAQIRQIETWIGDLSENKGDRAKLTVIHHCGDNNKELISQLETMIYGLKNGFEAFAK